MFYRKNRLSLVMFSHFLLTH